MQTFVRVREQVHSNLIGLHVDSIGGMTADRLAAYRGAVGAHSSDAALAAGARDEPACIHRGASRPRCCPTSTVFCAAVGALGCLLLTAFCGAIDKKAGRSSGNPRSEGREAQRLAGLFASGRAQAPIRKRGTMRTAYCFTPDRAFFAPAVRAIASLVEAEPDVEREIFLICEPDDVAPGFDKLPAPLRERIKLMTLDFTRFDPNLAGKGRFSRAVFRRLFLDDILPAHFERIVTVNSDMLIVRPGLERLESFDLGRKPLAAAYDMIFLMDFKGDALARQFQRSRRALGLAIDTPYFNAGLMTIDRAAWRAEKLTERVTKALRDQPERYPFMEQDALNAALKGDFAALSPRFNFMGDFFLSISNAGSSRSCCISSTRRSPGSLAHGAAKRGSLKTIAPGSPRRPGRTWRSRPPRRLGGGPGRRSRRSDGTSPRDCRRSSPRRALSMGR